MTIGKIYKRDVLTLTPEMSLQEAAKLMGDHNIGSILVVENKQERSSPCGILTDRDIVIRAIAKENNLSDIRVGDVMTKELTVLKENQGIKEVIDIMCKHKVRRAPIVDDNNHLSGMVSLDDLFIVVATELKEMAKIIEQQIR